MSIKKARAELWPTIPFRDYLRNAMRYLNAVLFQFLKGFSSIVQLYLSTS